MVALCPSRSYDGQYHLVISDMTYETNTTNSEDTLRLGAIIAKHLQGGETIELASDLGGGKTTLVQGLAEALGYEGRVTSPTFTLSNIYKIRDDLEIHHYDLYRLGEAGVVGQELAEDFGQPEIVTIIEWAGVANHELPSDRLQIMIEVTGDTARNVKLVSSGPISAGLLEGAKHDLSA